MIKNIPGALACVGIAVMAGACSGPKKAAKIDNVSFNKTTLSNEYISEGVAVADVDKDGQIDVLAGSFWWKAPNWERSEITTPYIHPSIGGYGNSFLNYSMDVNLDGWDDMIKIGFPSKEAFWYENPKNKPGHWTERLIQKSVGNESPTFVDIDGDGRLDLLCNDPANKKVVWVSPPTKKNDTAWTTYIISNDSLIGTNLFEHGLGFGDINKDGRKDVVIRKGWWEAPVDRKQSDWKWHPADLGAECSQMFVFDFDGDGDNDVVSASAHNYGIWWHEQTKQADTTAWISHEIFKEFSQSHGMRMEDVNNDGNPDLITGKRFWAHNGGDPGEKEPAVIYWFEYVPGKDPKWIPHLIDDNSGVGLNFQVEDLNGDKKKDIIIGNKKGVFVFKQN
ncbi:MAG: VCBS repeat-containing protein [Chitinophagaceae bacterium]|nr:VCBS repeat-containing protein [Chitinophagaceae bacterium]